MGKTLVGCCGWSYVDMAEKGAGLERFILEPIRKNFPIIPSSSRQRRWIPRSMKNSTNT